VSRGAGVERAAPASLHRDGAMPSANPTGLYTIPGYPREVFKPAIMAGFCAALLVAHNHPSSDPEPSSDDLTLTRRLGSAGALLGIEVLDHLILGEASRFVSLKERGVL
jgi:DNA repair protein RadC